MLIIIDFEELKGKMSVKITFSSAVNASSPKTDGVVVIGKQENLNKLKDFPEVLKAKFGEQIDEQVLITFLRC